MKVSSATKSKVELFTLTLASFRPTITVIFLLSAAAYLSLPIKRTVTLATPSPTAVIVPIPLTVTTLTSLDVKSSSPAPEGIMLTTGSNSSLTFISAVTF